MNEGELEQFVGAWTEHMRHGDFDQAWEVSDALLRDRAGGSCDHLPPEKRWVWNGSALSGRRVLVRCFRGLGDTIQFIRYLPMLKRVAAETIVSAPAELMPLVATVHGVDRVVEEDYIPTPRVPHDVQVEVMELPFVFRTTRHDIPIDVPYLHVEPMPLAPWAGPSVGIVWKSGEWDPRRSVPFPLMACLPALTRVRWIVIQRGPGLDEWDGRMGLLSPAATIFEQARVIRSLDLVITVDSMPAHLAGALGVPTWILLHAQADWRWLELRDDTPWYPDARLFRQERPGDWQPVLARVRDALANGGLSAPSSVA